MEKKKAGLTIGLVFTFLGVIAVIVVCFIAIHGKRDVGDHTKALPWWKEVAIYQAYPRSLFDAVADGTGDIKGITSKADYLKALGIGAVWLSPVYTSPMADFGYDISNFTDIDPVFGTMDDFDELLRIFHKKGDLLYRNFPLSQV
ncbi:Maltase A2 [Halocaridina rubra]|uniref:Maltase A2 n=1 Tax=Halocaridina rubra TaxID=373956 RepID=A0AAN9AAY0_HALRR